MTRTDVSVVIQEVENCSYDAERMRRHLDEGIASLVRCGVLEPAATADGNETPDGFTLSRRAGAFAGERFAAIEREIERLATDFDVDVAVTSEEPEPSDVSDSNLWDLDRTSRTFLEDVLQQADILPDLLEMVVRTYAQDGRIHMSEDGRRYVIHLRRAG